MTGSTKAIAGKVLLHEIRTLQETRYRVVLNHPDATGPESLSHANQGRIQTWVGALNLRGGMGAR